MAYWRVGSGKRTPRIERCRALNAVKLPGLQQYLAKNLGYELIDAAANDDPVKELEIIRNFSKRGVELLILGSTTQAAV